MFAGNEVLWINSNLKVVQHKDIVESASIITIDTLLKLKQPYYITSTQQQNGLNIFTEDFDEVIALQFSNENIKSVKTKTDKGADIFFVRTNRNEYYFRLIKNRSYYIKYPLYLLIYMLSVLFIWLMQMIREKQLQEKFELQNKVRELQLRTLKNQLDPHFIFNTFNTIASIVKQGRNDEAYDIMVRFSKMVRSNLENPSDIYTTLKGELDFIKDYLSIQKSRFKNLFEYEITVENTVNINAQIPKLLIQIHVENALKHGIKPNDKDGFLHIRIIPGNTFIKIEIEDNGVGREKLKQLRTKGIGIGLKTIGQVIEMNNQSRKHKITQKIIDLFDDNDNATGTKIEIILHS